MERERKRIEKKRSRLRGGRGERREALGMRLYILRAKAVA